MMLPLLILLGKIAFVASVLTIGFGLYFETREDAVQQMVDVVGGLASAFLWFTFAFGATSVQVATGGSIIDDGSAYVAIIGAAFGVLMLAVAFVGTAWLLDVRDLARQGV